MRLCGCEDVVNTKVVDDRCRRVRMQDPKTECLVCKTFVKRNVNPFPGTEDGKGPPHWYGRASKATGTDVRDFAYEQEHKES